MITGPCGTYNQDTAFQVLLRAAHYNMIGQQEMALLLTENFPALDPACVTAQGFDLFDYLMHRVRWQTLKFCACPLVLAKLNL